MTTQIPKISVDIDRTKAKQGLDEINSRLVLLRQELGKSNRAVQAINRSLGISGAKRAKQGLDGVGRSAKKATAAVKKTEKEVKDLNLGLFETAKTAQFAFGPLSGLAARITAFGTLVRATSIGIGVFTLALAGTTLAIGAASREAIKFGRAMIEVRKNAGLNIVQFGKLSKSVLAIAKATGIGAEKVASIADQAGRLGIKGSKNIAKFTKTIAELTVVTNLTEGAATSLARLLTVTGQSVNDIQTLGAVITALGANIAATETEIVATAQEIARATAIFDVSAEKAAALGAAFIATGARPEAIRTALLKTFNTIQDGLAGMQKKAEVLVELFGKPLSELRKEFEADSATFLVNFVGALAKAKREGKLLFPILKKLSLGNVRVAAVLQGGVKASGQFQKAFAIARAQEILPTETIKQLQVFTAGTGQQIREAGQEIKALAITIGNAFLPAIALASTAIGGLAKVINKILTFGEPTEVEKSRRALIDGLTNVLEGIGVKATRKFTPADFGADIRKTLLLQQLPFKGTEAALRTGGVPFNRIEDFARVAVNQIVPKIASLAKTFAGGGPQAQGALRQIATVRRARDELAGLAKTANLTKKSQAAVNKILAQFDKGLAEGQAIVLKVTAGRKNLNKAIENSASLQRKELVAKSKAATKSLRVSLLGTAAEKVRLVGEKRIAKIQASEQTAAEKIKQIAIVRLRTEKDLAALQDQEREALIRRAKARGAFVDKKLSSSLRDLQDFLKGQKPPQFAAGFGDAFFELFRGSKVKDVVTSFGDKLRDTIVRPIADQLGKALAKAFKKVGGEIGLTLAQGFAIGLSLTGSTAGGVGGAIGAAAGESIGKTLGGKAGGKIGKAIGVGIGSVIGNALFGGGPKAVVKIGSAFGQLFTTVVDGSKKAVAAARDAGNKLAEVFNGISDSLDVLKTSGSPFAGLFGGTEINVKTKKKRPFRISIGGKKMKFATIDEVAVALLDDAVSSGAFANASPVLQKVLGSIQPGFSIGDIENAVKFAEDFASGFGTLLPDLTAFGQEIKELKETFQKARASAAQFGLAVKGVDLAEQIKLQKKQVDFNKQIKLSILDIVDPLQAELTRLKDTQATRLKDAKEIGANIVAVEKLNALEQEQAVKNFASQTTNVLRDFLTEITASPQSKLPTQTSLANAQRRFSQTRIDFLAGNVGLSSDLVDAGRNLLDLRRSLDASGPGFFSTQTFVEDTLRRALDVQGAQTDPQLEVLQELNLDIKDGNETLDQIKEILAGIAASGATDGGTPPPFSLAAVLQLGSSRPGVVGNLQRIF